jgi:predicted enzyme related to lactoylglutathione lyase
MSKIESYAPGSFCWAELATSDTDSAERFYTEMFGWTAIHNPMPEGVYTIFQVDGNDAAAMYKAQPGMPPHWGVYFSVESADESAAKVASLGGKVIAGPFDVMEHGRMAVAQDPQGVTFCLWQAKAHIGAKHGGPLGQVMWPELSTPDPVGAVAFYGGLFGWTTNPQSGLETAQYIEWVNRGSHFGGLMPMRGDIWKGVPPHWMVYITVADCDERAAKAKELGAQVCVAPTDIPNVGRFSVITDAQGATFSLIQLGAAQRPAAA